MESDATRVVGIVVGLGANVAVMGVDDVSGAALRVHVRTLGLAPRCEACDRFATLKDTDEVELVDLAAFGRPTRLVWHKRRWHCPNTDCDVGSFTEQDPTIAPPRQRLTTRAGRWVTVQVGRRGRPVSDLASELGCGWHTINDAVIDWGQALLDADTARIGAVDALGLDETLFCRRGPFRHQAWCTSIVDVRSGQLLDLVEGRDAGAPTRWIAAMPQAWRDRIRWAVMDLSGPYRKTYDTILPGARQVADPFHVVKLANSKIDDCRRRIQNQTLHHRGRRNDPLYRARKLLTMGRERLDPDGHVRLTGLLEAGDPNGELRLAWLAKEAVRSFYTNPDRGAAAANVWLLSEDMCRPQNPPEVRQLGRTIYRWRTQIANWHWSNVSNGPTESINNLIKRVKRVAFGFRVFDHYRIRALLYAGRPNWALLDAIIPA